MFQTGATHMDTYKDNDLSIGAQLNIWGRRVVLCDCDDFTKEFFATKYGISESPTPNYKSGQLSSTRTSPTKK